MDHCFWLDCTILLLQENGVAGQEAGVSSPSPGRNESTACHSDGEGPTLRDTKDAQFAVKGCPAGSIGSLLAAFRKKIWERMVTCYHAKRTLETSFNPWP